MPRSQQAEEKAVLLHHLRRKVGAVQGVHPRERDENCGGFYNFGSVYSSIALCSALFCFLYTIRMIYLVAIKFVHTCAILDNARFSEFLCICE